MAAKMALVTLMLSFLLAAANAENGIYRATMIHRHTETGTINFTQAAHQSRHRLSMLALRLNKKTLSRVVDAQTPLTEDGKAGVYDMEISIGTPPQKLTALADTGSDLIWAKCGACSSCEPKGSPSYYPDKSSSFSKLRCFVPLCTALMSESDVSCGDGGAECDYRYSYGLEKDSHHYTQGYLANETFTLGGDTVPEIGFGCTTMSEGSYGSGSALIGLSRGPLSLVSQLNVTGFSYCLTSDASKKSPLLFGSGALLKGSGVQSTPFISEPDPSYYSVNLQSITIGDVTTPGTGYSGIVFDSGTTVTYLTDPAYTQAKAAVLRQTNLARAPDRDGFEACYQSPSNGRLAVPSMVLHFDGADMALAVKNYFVDMGDGVVCWFVQMSPSVSIIGNVMQVDFHVLHDVNNSVLSFQPANCDSLSSGASARLIPKFEGVSLLTALLCFILFLSY
ncbi:hypothetical protein HU200_033721 [Digitaria exilis]|uniref:Peptidase A1 domain-containing protein n=1 Tax=Digitaria exilis TaxID=1010633 RepID=A0A835EMR9_9POAL|nr:hypothetical protein HU200_033721 [Digitaria exilis]CAB3489635.1 unnamed protein product [Digitaria exilis]